MSENSLMKRDFRLVSDVSKGVGRVVAGLADASSWAAIQMHPECRDIRAYIDCATGHAEMLEREARNIRDAIEKYSVSAEERDQ